MLATGSGLTNLSATKLVGQIFQTNLPANAVTNTQTGVTLSGTFNGNGSGLTNLPANVAMLSSTNQIFTGINTFATTNLVISSSVANPTLTIIGHGGGGAGVAINLNTYVVGTSPPSSQILATDDGGFGNTLDLMTKTDGSIANALISRLHIAGNGDVGIGVTNTAQLFAVGSGGAYCNGTSWVNGSDRNTKQAFDASTRLKCWPRSRRCPSRNGNTRWRPTARSISGRWRRTFMRLRLERHR